jgi:hypothetical protein
MKSRDMRMIRIDEAVARHLLNSVPPATLNTGCVAYCGGDCLRCGCLLHQR